MFAGATIVALVAAAFVLITILMGVRQVPQGWNYTVERFGRYYKTLAPGLGVIVPYIDTIGHKLNMMEQVRRRSEPGNHHQGQRDRHGRRHRVLSGARRAARVL